MRQLNLCPHICLWLKFSLAKCDIRCRFPVGQRRFYSSRMIVCLCLLKAFALSKSVWQVSKNHICKWHEGTKSSYEIFLYKCLITIDVHWKYMPVSHLVCQDTNYFICTNFIFRPNDSNKTQRHLICSGAWLRSSKICILLTMNLY